MREYAKIGNFIIAAVTKEERVVGFAVTDRNGERVTDKLFRVASDAIGWANTNYVELVK